MSYGEARAERITTIQQWGLDERNVKASPSSIVQTVADPLKSFKLAGYLANFRNTTHNYETVFRKDFGSSCDNCRTENSQNQLQK